MSENKYNLDEMKKENPFKVPEGYFENLSSQIMANLPEQEKAKTISLWGRMKTWSYAAAVLVAGIFLVNFFIGLPSQDQHKEFNLSSAAEMDEYMNYYEEQMMEDLYQESIYSDIYDDEWDFE
jgi:hypothetical protein